MIATDHPSRIASALTPDPFGPARIAAAGLELREAVRIVQRRRIAILTALGLGIVLAVLSVLFATNRYSATATIEVNRESGSTLGLADLSGTTGGLGGLEGMNMDLLTQQAVILNDNTALRTIEELHLDATGPYAPEKAAQTFASERNLPLDRAPHRRELALRVFRSGLRVNAIKGTRLLTVTFTDTDPTRAAAIANAVVDTSMFESTQAKFQASSKTSAWLTGQLSDLKRKVSESQAKVDAFQRASGLAGMTAAASGQAQAQAATSVDNVALARLAELNRDLTNAEVRRIAAEAIYKITESRDPTVVLGTGSSELAGSLASDSPIAHGSADLVQLQHLHQRLADVEVRRAGESTKYGAKNPVMLQLANEQASIETQIRSELDRIRARAKNDLDLATLDENGLRRQVAEQEQVVNRVAEKADQLLLLEEEARSSRAIYQDLYAKLEEASVTAGIKASNITLVDPARTPAQPSYPQKKMTFGLGALAGLLCGLLAAFTWDYFDDSVALPEEAEQIASVPVIGTIPDFDRKQSIGFRYGRFRREGEGDETKPQAWPLRAPRSEIAEAYRALRTALLLSRVERAPHVILFMSGSAEEGKSTTCLNTAAAFALQGDRVLYLDADLRRAKGHRFFGCTNETGLSNCLAGGTAFPAALQPYPGIPSLFLLPAGRTAPNPSELLGSRRFADLIGELRTHFEYIFIDSPPVLLVTDAQLIAPRTDGCVLVMRANRTLKRCLRRSLALMRASNASMLGTVMNAFKTQTAAYSAYGYYGKGSEYYAETE